MTVNKLTKIVLIILVAACLVATLVACSDKGDGDEPMLTADKINYLDEIKETGSLKFEWLKDYNASKPTLIVVHGEMTGQSANKFSIDLDENVYSFKTSENPTDYVVADNIGYKGQGLDLQISRYWTDVADYNVAIFHWERFADENDVNDVVAKIYSVPKMRYVTGDNVYETTKVPKYPLAEVFGALYFAEMSDKLNGREIRIVGNGVGCELVLSGMEYLSYYVGKNQLDKNYLPSRLTLCDPYLSGSDLSIKMPWGDITTDHGTIGVDDAIIGDLASRGVVMEMVESLEISSVDEIVDGQTTKKTVKTYAYGNEEKSEISEKHFDSIKSNLAYLTLRESYTPKMSTEYKAAFKAQKRIALDWYLYSIIGSDDSGNAGANGASGYPRNIADYQTYFSYSGFNWSDKETRPLVNNRQLNNDYFTTYAANRGKNFGLSAWTPTVYTRGLKGVSFDMKKYLSATTVTNVHGNPEYSYSDYTMNYFRSENFQVSDQDFTIVCGYVYVDKNNDLIMNEGRNGVPNANVSVSITTGSDSDIKNVASFTIKTDESGFYAVRLDDKAVDEDGTVSDKGYAFATEHTLKLTVEPLSHDYTSINTAASGIFYRTVNMHNFSKYECSVTLNNYVADSVLVRNCLVKKD